MRSRTVIRLVLGVMPVLAGLLAATPAAAAPPRPTGGLAEVTGFGANPSNLKMYVYIPASVTRHPAVVVAVHYCHGDAPAFYAGSEFASLADRHGFIVVYHSVTDPTREGCFDVASPQALTRDGGSDPVGIHSMVRYAQRQYHGDRHRTFATGVSSGAMMTNVLLGLYPDVFRAGAAFAGVPFGCFAGPGSWNTDCANGLIDRTPQQWGDLIRAAYPGYRGPRPRVQLWHGSEDTVLHYRNLGEEIEQWTNVHGLSPTPASTDHPQPTWTRTRYTDRCGRVAVEAISMAGEPHNLPVRAPEAIAFFGLDT